MMNRSQLMLKMFNSQDTGPSQVQDLSESWDEDMLLDSSRYELSEALRRSKVCPTIPADEVPAAAHGALQLHFTFHEVSPLTIGYANGSHTCHTLWLGAQFPCVRGSTPPTVTLGYDCRPYYLIPAVRRIDTLAS